MLLMVQQEVRVYLLPAQVKRNKCQHRLCILSFQELNTLLVHILNLFLSVIVDYSNSGETLNIPLVQIRNIVHSISEYLNNPDEEVRRASMEILFILDAESALLFVDSMCNDENIWNRLRLVEILETLNLPDVNIALLKLAGDPDEMVRERANEIINQRNINENNPITN